MLIPRDGMALVASNPLLGRVRDGLPATTSHHPWWLKPNPNTKKIAGTAANSENAGKSKAPHGGARQAPTPAGLAETAETARTLKTSMKCASEEGHDIPWQLAQTREADYRWACCPAVSSAFRDEAATISALWRRKSAAAFSPSAIRRLILSELRSILPS